MLKIPLIHNFRATTATAQSQQRAAALANSILQAQMAENVAARAQLLSHRTQELNDYSIAIEEMLRSLNALPTEAGSAGASASSTVPSAPTGLASPSQSRGSRTTSEDGIMRGPMPTSSGIRSRTASAGSSTGVSAGSSISAPAHVAAAPSAATPLVGTLGTTGYGRVYASSIMPGSLRSGVGRPSAFLVTPAGLQTAVRGLDSEPAVAAPPSTTTTSAAGVPSLAASRTNWMPPATAVASSTAPTVDVGTEDGEVNEDHEDNDPYADSFEVEEDEDDYSVSLESAEQREGEPTGSLSVHSFHSIDASSEGQDRNDIMDGENEEEEEEEAAPLDDLLPTLSFNELGQSLMDVRGARSRLNQETALQQEDADTHPIHNGKILVVIMTLRHATIAK